MDNHLFETHTKYVTTYGRHIYANASNMAMTTRCAYPLSQHALPQWKCVLLCCANFPSIDLQGKHSDRNHSNTYPSISFHIYNLISNCTVHGRRPLYEKKICIFIQYPGTM